MTKLQKAFDKLGVSLETIINDYMLTSTEINKIKKQYKIIQELINQQSNPILSECIKKWEEKGFIVENDEFYMFLNHEQYGISMVINKKETKYHIYFGYISLELNELLNKTLKALEVKKDDK
jgi:hypothetical protein